MAPLALRLFIAIWLTLRPSCFIQRVYKSANRSSRTLAQTQMQGTIDDQIFKASMLLMQPCLLTPTSVNVDLGLGSSSSSCAHSICRCCYEDRFIKNDGCGANGQQFCIISKGRPPECSTRHPGFSCHKWNLRVAPQTGGPLREGR